MPVAVAVYWRNIRGKGFACLTTEMVQRRWSSEEKIRPLRHEKCWISHHVGDFRSSRLLLHTKNAALLLVVRNMNLLLTLALSSLVAAYPSRRQDGFSNTATFTFDAGVLPSSLAVSNYPAGRHRFTADNAFVTDGYLQLKVPGGQTVGNVLCGEVTTTTSNILYGSVRTVAVLSQPAGIVNGLYRLYMLSTGPADSTGMFFYKSDTQESDIEWLSDPASQSNNGQAKLWFTNQNVDGNGPSTYSNILPPADATEVEHEYRTDWYADHVAFYVDGEQKWSTTENVPSTPGSWIWNNWSDGDPGWSAGPPAQDALFKIRNITMYYNTA